MWPEMAGCSVNDDLEGTWKEAVLAYLKWFCRYLPGGSEEDYKAA